MQKTVRQYFVDENCSVCLSCFRNDLQGVFLFHKKNESNTEGVLKFRLLSCPPPNLLPI